MVAPSGRRIVGGTVNRFHGTIGGLVATLLTASILVGCSTSALGGSKNVTLKLSGSGSADVTYGVDGKISQLSSVSLPWSKQVGPGTIFSVTGQLKGSGTITCSIVDSGGKATATATSSGQYVIASC